MNSPGLGQLSWRVRHMAGSLLLFFQWDVCRRLHCKFILSAERGGPQGSHRLCYERCAVSCHACLIKLSSSKRHFTRYCSWNDDERYHLRGWGCGRHLRKNICLPLASPVLPVVQQPSRDAGKGACKTGLDTELGGVWDTCSADIKGKSSPASGLGNPGSHHLDNQVAFIFQCISHSSLAGPRPGFTHTSVVRRQE